jgi:hypothetical protein
MCLLSIISGIPEGASSYRSAIASRGNISYSFSTVVFVWFFAFILKIFILIEFDYFSSNLDTSELMCVGFSHEKPVSGELVLPFLTRANQYKKVECFQFFSNFNIFRA